MTDGGGFAWLSARPTIVRGLRRLKSVRRRLALSANLRIGVSVITFSADASFPRGVTSETEERDLSDVQGTSTQYSE